MPQGAAEGDTVSGSTPPYVFLRIYRIFTGLPRKEMLLRSIAIFSEEASKG